MRPNLSLSPWDAVIPLSAGRWSEVRHVQHRLRIARRGLLGRERADKNLS